jgi:hypothetical protein
VPAWRRNARFVQELEADAALPILHIRRCCSVRTIGMDFAGSHTNVSLTVSTRHNIHNGCNPSLPDATLCMWVVPCCAARCVDSNVEERSSVVSMHHAQLNSPSYICIRELSCERNSSLERQADAPGYHRLPSSKIWKEAGCHTMACHSDRAADASCMYNASSCHNGCIN